MYMGLSKVHHDFPPHRQARPSSGSRLCIYGCSAYLYGDAGLVVYGR